MYIFQRLKILFKFIFYKKVDVLINGVHISMDRGVLSIDSIYFRQNYEKGFLGCSQEQINQIMFNPPGEFTEEEIVSHKKVNTCKGNCSE